MIKKNIKKIVCLGALVAASNLSFGDSNNAPVTVRGSASVTGINLVRTDADKYYYIGTGTRANITFNFTQGNKSFVCNLAGNRDSLEDMHAYGLRPTPHNHDKLPANLSQETTFTADNVEIDNQSFDSFYNIVKKYGDTQSYYIRYHAFPKGPIDLPWASGISPSTFSFYIKGEYQGYISTPTLEGDSSIASSFGNSNIKSAGYRVWGQGGTCKVFN